MYKTSIISIIFHHNSQTTTNLAATLKYKNIRIDKTLKTLMTFQEILNMDKGIAVA